MALIDWRDDPRAARTDPRLHPDQARSHAREPRLKFGCAATSHAERLLRAGAIPLGRAPRSGVADERTNSRRPSRKDRACPLPDGRQRRL